MKVCHLPVIVSHFYISNAFREIKTPLSLFCVIPLVAAKKNHVFVLLRPPKKRFEKNPLPGRCFGSFGRCYAWASDGCGVVEGGLWCIRHHLCWEGCCWTPSSRLGCGGGFLVVGNGLKRWKASKRLGRGRYVVLLWLRLSDKRGVSVVLCGSIVVLLLFLLLLLLLVVVVVVVVVLNLPGRCTGRTGIDDAVASAEPGVARHCLRCDRHPLRREGCTAWQSECGCCQGPWGKWMRWFFFWM